jgi:glycosyltransferase involved in cell wall biosynthesis
VKPVPLVSIVIPTYNREKLVLRAIESALAQTYASKEVIVVNDGSTDDSARIISKTFGLKVRLFNISNGGVSSARNFGVSRSNGQYIAFLDSDDFWDKRKLEQQINEITSDLEYALTDAVFIDDEQVEQFRFKRSEQFDQDLGWLAQVLIRPYLLPSTLLVGKDAFLSIGGFDSRLITAEDLDLHIRLAARGRPKITHHPLTYCQVPSKDGLSELDQSTQDHLNVVLKHAQSFKEKLTDFEYNSVLFEAYRKNADGAARSKLLRPAVSRFASAARHSQNRKHVSQLFALAILIIRCSLSVLKNKVLRQML